MKSNGPVTASRLTTVEPPPSMAASSFFTAFVLPGAVSISTYARIFFDAPFVMWHLPRCASTRHGAKRVEQRGPEPGVPLDEPQPLQIDPRPAMLRVVRRIEGRDEPGHRGAGLQREGLAHALVAEPRHDQEEALLVGQPQVREAGLVADQLQLAPGHRAPLRVLHEAEDD